METMIRHRGPLRGEITVAPDKSISHRAAIFSALAQGEGVVRNFLLAEDTLSSVSCLRQLGIAIAQDGSCLRVKGRGIRGLQEAEAVLDCGNSGTTMRLLAGVLAAQPFYTTLSGDSSLNRRPMKRVFEPLRLMGAQLWGRMNDNYPPLAIKGQQLRGIHYPLPVASAQVKSALLLAGLYADGETLLIEPEKSRDHSENMLTAMGADIRVNGKEIALKPGGELEPQEFLVPGDISSAAFFLVAASLIPGSELLIRDVGVNPTRAGIIEVLLAMGARIVKENLRRIGGEEVADLVVTSSHLCGVNIDNEIVPRLIDEIPVLAVAMAMAEGESRVKGAGELRVKESDRIKAICIEQGKMGVNIEELEDGFIIQGNPGLPASNQRDLSILVDSHGDHRIAMSLAVAALCFPAETRIAGTEAVNISFPDFWNLLEQLRD